MRKLTKIRRFEKCNFKFWKCHVDFRFLLDCKKNGVIPKFFLFKQDTLKILMCTRIAKSDCWKKKSNESERRLIPWKRMHRGLRKNYKEHFLF